MRAALIDDRNRVIGEVFDSPETGNTIRIAGCFDADGFPINVSIYRISRSKRNVEKAKYERPVSLSKTGVYTFECVENGDVVY